MLLININVNDVVDKFFKPFAFCIIKVFKKKFKKKKISLKNLNEIKSEVLIPN